MTLDRIEREIQIAAPPETVWRYVNEPGFWASDAHLGGGQAREGESVVVRHSQHGDFPIRVEASTEPRYVAYRWVSAFPGEELDELNSTLVEFTLTPHSGGTRLRVVESGLASLPTSDDNRRNVVSDHTAGWAECLGLLADRVDRAA